MQKLATVTEIEIVGNEYSYGDHCNSRYDPKSYCPTDEGHSYNQNKIQRRESIAAGNSDKGKFLDLLLDGHVNDSMLHILRLHRICSPDHVLAVIIDLRLFKIIIPALSKESSGILFLPRFVRLSIHPSEEKFVTGTLSTF